MQNKGLIKIFAFLFGLVSIYQLSYTYLANKVESDAKHYAVSQVKDGNSKAILNLERKYLDSIKNKKVILGNTYKEVKDREMKLGLDLKGGINAILQVSVKDILISLSGNSKDVTFNKALAITDEAQKDSQDNYLDLFVTEFEKIAGDKKLSSASIFRNRLLSDKIKTGDSNEDVKKVLQKEINTSIKATQEVLRTRIDKFGAVQPKIQRIGNSGRIQIELPGAKDIVRVRKLIENRANLQFWEVYSAGEMFNFLIKAEQKSKDFFKDETTETKKGDDLLGDAKDSTTVKRKSLFYFLSPTQAPKSPVIGYVKVKDTAIVNDLLRKREIYSLMPNSTKYAKFLWDYKPYSRTLTEEEIKKGVDNPEIIALYAMKSNRDDAPFIEGDIISDAKQDFETQGRNAGNPIVSMSMNATGTRQWAKMTAKNLGKCVAVVLDDEVYTAPTVNVVISGGGTIISGPSMTVNEAKDLATVLKAGKLPAPSRIIQADVVGPSLGKEAITASIWSFALAIVLILVWMVLYYGKAGMFANIALLVNILFIFGALASFGATLTLPGIAGIILTIGMSVDANVIIFERIKEALDRGLGLKESVDEGFSVKGALSAIIDANITTFLTGIILYAFGTGPIQGFALTLMVGILTSLFTAILITRILVDGVVEKGGKLPFNTAFSKNWFKNLNFDFLSKRKIAYMISGAVIIAGLVSMFTLGLKQGVDFKGGRSYIVRFDHGVKANEVAFELGKVFGSDPEVKTFGASNQLKITTVYNIDSTEKDADEKVQKALFTGVHKFIPNVSYDNFKLGVERENDDIGIMSYMKVEPTIADDIKQDALFALLGSLLVVFLYILLRFRKVSYSLGAVVAVFHDVLIVLAVFSITYTWMPFDMEIGESFIAALLTVIGYSLNDTVVIFDRIREFTQGSNVKISEKVVNKSLNTTLGRTINTSLTTMLVMLAIFLFGGDSIKGFMFALIIGVIVGTYSSLFVATPVMYDVTKKDEKE